MQIEKINTNPMNILLVEDDDGDAKSIVRGFRKTKIANEIVRAVDGIEALEILQGENGKDKIRSPYLLLVDINMPRMNGIQLIKALRDDSKLHNSIVFVLTTSNREEDKIASYNLNIAGYITKDKAGHDFLKLIDLIDSYWRIVEIP